MNNKNESKLYDCLYVIQTNYVRQAEQTESMWTAFHEEMVTRVTDCRYERSDLRLTAGSKVIEIPVTLDWLNMSVCVAGQAEACRD